MNRAIFLDRDGTISTKEGIHEHPEYVELFPFTIDVIKKINQSPFLVIIATNQAGIGRGYFPVEKLIESFKKVQNELIAKDTYINGFYYCPHREDATIDKYKIKCACRKPGSGMLLKAAQDFDIDLENSYMIGDTMADIGAGLNAGLKTGLVLTGDTVMQKDEVETFHPDFIFPNIEQAVDTILSLENFSGLKKEIKKDLFFIREC
ncbi:MAG: HAD-IIIA family hydrolase [bacterium]|nr:HAD-IIIA family hydrolase [bacterium]